MKTCAPADGVCAPVTSGLLPVVPAEIASARRHAAKAGAPVIRLRNREWGAGKPDPRPGSFRRFLRAVTVSTRRGSSLARNERYSAAMPGGAKMTSLDLGSMNFRVLPPPARISEWKPDGHPGSVVKCGDDMMPGTAATTGCANRPRDHANGTKLGGERNGPGHLVKVGQFADRRETRPPLFVQPVQGVLGGAGTPAKGMLGRH